ncbi:MAG TPA: molybdate ABC transporter substrate-binding protein [Bacteroidota bacterium]|nr:molybdate ABC transporter substrate-binding protein [Bacteroidota bacterium]
MKRILAILLVVIFSININAQTVRVAAAGNLRFVMDDIKALYAEKHPEVKIEASLGASGALLQQIINGAQFDFFMAADKTFPDKLKEQGAASGDVKTYAFGKLALWSNVVDVRKGIEVVTDSAVVHIAVAKPEVAPYGERAVQALKYYGLFDKVKHKIVYADNIAQAAQYASTGNAEVGFLALALVLAPDMKNKGNFFMLDTKSYKPVEQACVLVKTWERNPEASKFMDFVLSDACRPIFEKYGFILP